MLGMTKDQLLKEAAIEWLLNGGSEDVGELLESVRLGTYKEE